MPATTRSTTGNVTTRDATTPAASSACTPTAPTYNDVATARRRFPRGLTQPAGGFRASVDALLLADFVQQTCPARPFTFAELGVGNGMAACALALGAPQAQGVGVDAYPPALDAARENLRRLGLDDRVCALAGDVTAADFAPTLTATLAHKAVESVPPLLRGAARVDVVLTNPPYRAAGAGRRCRDDGREQALVEHAANDASGTLSAFCRAAARLLNHHGRLYCVYAAARLPYLLHCLRMHGFGLRRLCAVYTRPAAGARFVLAEGRLRCADDVCLTDLRLYEQQPPDIQSS